MLNRNSPDFVQFLKWLEHEKCYKIGELFEVIDKPECYNEEYREFHNFHRIKESDGKVVNGKLSECCDAEVVSFGSGDEVCVNCFKECEMIEDWVNPLQSCKVEE